MKHYKKGKNHIFEFGTYSIKQITLRQSEYVELQTYFLAELLPKKTDVKSKQLKP